MRKLLIAANWKMHPLPDGALDHTSSYHPRNDVDVIVFPSFLDIRLCTEAQIVTGAQCGSSEAIGAHTGDVSMSQIAQVGCRYVLCGHSERRQDHRETNEDIAAQAIAALEAGLHPLVCIGETAEDRDTGKAQDVVSHQLQGLPLESTLTLAYEPVWAIGTGNTATPELAQEMHAFIRSLLPNDQRENTRILYGGSMKPSNAKDLLLQPDIDGGLIGSASLQPKEFQEIVQIASEV